MRILLDQGFGRTCAALLRAGGFDVVHVAEIDRHRDSDEGLIAFARTERRIIVTLDADFHAIIALSGRTSPSVVRVRVEGLRSPESAELIERVVAACEADLEAGALVTVEPTHLRSRRLPIREGPRE